MTQSDQRERDGLHLDPMFVSMSPNGTFYIPNRTYEEHFDGEEYVEVTVNPVPKRVFLSPTSEPGGRNIYKLRRNDEYGVRFSAMEVVTALTEDLESSVRADPVWHPDGDAILLAFGRVI